MGFGGILKTFYIMRKTLFFVMGLFSITTFAQQGNVGINSEAPKATLEINVASANTNNNTNQGIIVPQLSKQRIADITQTSLLDGTLIYANTFADITQTDATIKRRVSQITTKDFYKYNAERDLWERMSSKRLTKSITQNYTLSEEDYHYYLYVNSATEITITVPTELKDGFTCVIIQEGVGRVVVNGNAQGANGLKTKAQNSAIGVIIRNNIATITGDSAN